MKQSKLALSVKVVSNPAIWQTKDDDAQSLQRELDEARPRLPSRHDHANKQRGGHGV